MRAQSAHDQSEEEVNWLLEEAETVRPQVREEVLSTENEVIESLRKSKKAIQFLRSQMKKV